MPRPAKLRRHNGYWYSRAGTRAGVYFGKVTEVSFAEANKKFRKYLASLNEDRQIVALPRLSVAEVCDKHLLWVEQNRAASTYKQRKSILELFCLHTIAEHLDERLAGHGAMIAKLRAEQLSRAHVEQYLHHCSSNDRDTTGRPLGDKSLRAIVIAVKACWNWAADSKKDGGGGLLDEEERPLSRLPRGYVAPKDLTEADLLTDDEIEILFRWANVEPSQLRQGVGKWRRRVPDEYYTKDSCTFADMLKAYHATGARTSELCLVQVRDFMPRTSQLCLGKHKRSRTQHNPTLRTMQIGTELAEIFSKHARGKRATDPLFTHDDGKPWNLDQVNRRLNMLIELAAEHDQIVRDVITPYSFRDLYITELLMLGTEPFKVGKMAGTSVKEIERTYGHFFNEDLAFAQKRLDKARAKKNKKRKKRNPN